MDSKEIGRAIEIKEREQGLRCQSFKGKKYRLYPNERYFSSGRKRLHRVVWESYNGEITEGYHIHHIDGHTSNNNIENLGIVNKKLHLRYEGKKRARNNNDWLKEFNDKGRDAAKEWHASEEGKQWHKEQWKN